MLLSLYTKKYVLTKLSVCERERETERERDFEVVHYRPGLDLGKTNKKICCLLPAVSLTFTSSLTLTRHIFFVATITQ